MVPGLSRGVKVCVNEITELSIIAAFKRQAGVLPRVGRGKSCGCRAEPLRVISAEPGERGEEVCHFRDFGAGYHVLSEDVKRVAYAEGKLRAVIAQAERSLFPRACEAALPEGIGNVSTVEY